MRELKTVFLVGGEATRLSPLSDQKPKALLSIRGVTIIDSMFEKFSNVGLEEFILIAANQHKEHWEEYSKHTKYNVEVFYEDKKYDTAGFILNNLELFPNKFICTNGDLLLNLNLNNFLEYISLSKNSVLTTVEIEDPSRFGLVLFNEEDQINKFIEKPMDSSLGNHISAGLYYFNAEDLESFISKGRGIGSKTLGESISFEKDVFPFLAKSKLLFNCSLEGDVVDVGTRESFIKANCLDDNSWIHASSVVDKSAKVDNSVILDNCIIQENSIVINSIIGPNVNLESNSIIQDQIYC